MDLRAVQPGADLAAVARAITERRMARAGRRGGLARDTADHLARVMMEFGVLDDEVQTIRARISIRWDRALMREACTAWVDAWQAPDS